MKVRIDRGACGGSGLCAEICPGVFGQDPSYVAFVKEGGKATDAPSGAVVESQNQADVLDAASSCPTDAIVVDTGSEA